MTRESSIEQYLIDRVEEEGGEIRKVGWIGRKNAPDRLVMFKGFSAFVELKRPGKTLTDAQKREAHRMREAGLNVLMINSYGGVDYLVERRRK